MTERTSQILGLVGFVLAGVVFIAVGVRAGDALTVVGSSLWIVSCLIWITPLLRSDPDPTHVPTSLDEHGADGR